jgi:hypothetical protein
MYNDNELETRENLIRYFTRYLSLELNKVNPAFRFIRIETPVLTMRKTLRGEAWTPRKSMTAAAFNAAQELLTEKTSPKYRLPLVIWQHGKILDQREIYTLEYQILFSKTTGAKYFPVVVRCCEIMLRKQCGRVFKADEDDADISIFSHDDDIGLVRIRESTSFPGGKNIGVVFNLDTCTPLNIQHEFGKIRPAPPIRT